ncbi:MULTISPECIES: tyrosine-type recombinase/integrase [Clostridium]|uniref:Tyrosine-type recombinase/integrase n=1 Tax=Clostridium lapidicellarium TaxID=3240931 RepID=A0ABV4DVZ6_9CLOT
MKGTIRKYTRKDGTVTYGYLVYMGVDENGKKKYKRKRGFKKQKECETALAKFITQLEKGTVVTNDKMTIKEYMNYWLETYPKNHCQPSTYKRYKLFCRDIVHCLGGYKLTKLNPLLIQKFYEDLKNGTIKEDLKKQKILELQNAYSKSKRDSKEARNLELKIEKLKKQPLKGISNNTIIKTHRMFHEALKQAQKWQLIYVNPCDLVTPPPADEIVMNYWDPEDIHDYLEDLKGEFLYPIIFLAVHTGMREGELCALHWNDYDSIEKTITVNKTLQRIDGRLQEKKPKTKKSSRIVTLLDTTNTFLKQLKREEREKNRKVVNMDSKKERKDGYILHWEDGRPMDPHYVAQHFPEVLKKHNVPQIRFHDLRHTHATLLRKLKVNAEVISERLGHADVAFTLKTYTHVSTKMQREEVSKANDYL